ncbi:MAG: hypothetical protein COU25_01715 [Candidatus Levybacteria bacterium CG10_big_fil_rev_8_21_14_0_10_35_13]|nr:MAG: hypothetical protein COU25_01715 [Candidatus Levybacteria bacterium CG10_big_fil_rev_8_21_14_0_10_35_13]
MNLTCKHCDFPIAENFYFCPKCGKPIKKIPLSTSITKQIYIYTISILLPPLGLWPGIRYLLQDSSKARIIGIIAIVLTIFSIALTVKITTDFINSQASIANFQLEQLDRLNY